MLGPVLTWSYIKKRDDISLQTSFFGIVPSSPWINLSYSLLCLLFSASVTLGETTVQGKTCCDCTTNQYYNTESARKCEALFKSGDIWSSGNWCISKHFLDFHGPHAEAEPRNDDLFVNITVVVASDILFTVSLARPYSCDCNIIPSKPKGIFDGLP